MARVRDTQASLIGGISQQPDAIRFPSQAEDIENCWLSPVEGLVPRANTEHVAQMFSDKGGPMFFHTIDRSREERYVVAIRQNELKVFDLFGNEYPTHMPSSQLLADPLDPDPSAANWSTASGNITDTTVAEAPVLGPDGLASTGVRRLTFSAGGTPDVLTQTVPQSRVSTGGDYVGWIWVRPDDATETFFQLASGTSTVGVIVAWSAGGTPTITSAVTSSSDPDGITRYGVIPRGDGWYILWAALTHDGASGIAFNIGWSTLPPLGDSFDIWRPGLTAYDRETQRGPRDELWENRPTSAVIDGETFDTFDIPFIAPNILPDPNLGRIPEDYLDFRAPNPMNRAGRVGEAGPYTLAGGAVAGVASALGAPLAGNFDPALGTQGSNFFFDLVTTGVGCWDQVQGTLHDGPQVVACYVREGSASEFGLGLIEAALTTRAKFRWIDGVPTFEGNLVSTSPHPGEFVDAGAIQSPYDPDDWLVYAVFDPNNGGSTWTIGGSRSFRLCVEDTGNLYAWGSMLIDGATTPPGGFLAFVEPITRARALTINDFTFFLNPAVEVARGFEANSGELSESRAYIFVKKGGLSQRYKVEIVQGANSYTADVVTWDGTVITPYCSGAFGGNPQTMGTCVANGGTWVTANGLTTQDTAEIALDIADQLTTSGGGAITATARGSLVEVVVASGGPIDDVVVEDSQGDTALAVLWRDVEDLTDLPLNFRDGARIKIIGDQEDESDDYWVVFRTEKYGQFGTGVWEESTPPGAALRLDRFTMFRQLVRRADDSSGTVTGTAGARYFEWGTPNFDDRRVGDDDTNPFPDFVERSPSDLFFFQGRVGLTADESLNLTESGRFFNFFRTTISAGLLDSDPIQASTSHTKVSRINHAVPYRERLLLFSDRTQFTVTGDPVLTPATTAIRPALSFDNYRRARPVDAADAVFMPFPTLGFVDETFDFSGIRLIVSSENTADLASADITDIVPALIAGEIQDLTASAATSVLLARADHKLYAVKYLRDNGETRQQAWSRWTAGDAILGASFIEGQLILAVQRGGRTYLEKMRTGDFLTDTGLDFLVRLDQRFDNRQAGAAITYDAGLDRTTVTAPFTVDTSETWKCVRKSTGSDIPVLSVTSTTLVLQGDHRTTDFWIGQEYPARLEFTKPRLRRDGNPVPGRDHVIEGQLRFDDTHAFLVDVTQRWGQTFTSEFNAHQIGTGAAVPGTVPLVDGEFRFALGGRPEELTITVRSKSYLPFRLIDSSFVHFYDPRRSQFG